MRRGDKLLVHINARWEDHEVEVGALLHHLHSLTQTVWGYVVVRIEHDDKLATRHLQSDVAASLRTLRLAVTPYHSYATVHLSIMIKQLQRVFLRAVVNGKQLPATEIIGTDAVNHRSHFVTMIEYGHYYGERYSERFHYRLLIIANYIL